MAPYSQTLVQSMQVLQAWRLTLGVSLSGAIAQDEQADMHVLQFRHAARSICTERPILSQEPSE